MCVLIIIKIFHWNSTHETLGELDAEMEGKNDVDMDEIFKT